MKYTKADPKVFGSKPSYSQERLFKCGFRSINASENVRAGRDAGNTGKRFYFFPRYVTFDLNDRIVFESKTYEIISVQDCQESLSIAYVDTKAQQ